MALSFRELRDRGVVTELARVLEHGANARTLLEAISFPRARIPAAQGTPQEFWDAVCREIDNGLVEGGFEGLIRIARETYPYNQIFCDATGASGRADEGARVTRVGLSCTGGSAVAVRDCHDVYLVIDAARRLAQEHQLPGRIEPGYCSAGTLMLNLPDMTAEEALRLSQLLMREMEQRGQPLRFASAANEFRDYLISPIYVEGPDQARFELTNVPASTRVREIAQGIIGQYDPKMWGQDRSGKPRPTVVDQVKDDGATRRLDPDSTLHDNGIRDNSTLHVAPESTAGVHPNDRDEALSRVRLEVVAFAQKHRGFDVSANAQHMPTEYMFRFQIPSWAPPVEPGGQPVPIEDHEVFLVLPAEFPMKAPEAFWQSPIFHPNVDRATGFVCLGLLADSYRPGMDFGELCQMLMDMAAYQNYALEEGFDSEAQQWALSLEGQEAIERRGGRSIIRKVLSSRSDARPLEIKRSDS